MKNIKNVILVAGLALAALVPQAQANLLPISGSISFSGIGSTDNNANLSAATKLTSISTTVNTDSGDYSLVPSTYGPTSGTTYMTSTGTATGTGATLATAGLMSDYTFNPAQGAVTPLWSVVIGGVTYSFAATSMSAVYNAGLQEWNIGGGGIASITGHQDTSGTWNANIGQQGQSFFFGSAATVPDGGLSIALLGGALTAMSLVRSKLGKK